MKKHIFRALTLTLALVMITALMTGCGSGGEKNPKCLGTWSHVGGSGALTADYPPTESTTVSIADVITLFDDKTFTFVYDWVFDYTTDATNWYSLAQGTEYYYGTYEIVSEDAELGEKVIRVTSVTGCKGDDYDTSSDEYKDADEETKALFESKMSLLNGFEFTLTSYGHMDGEYLFVHSLRAGNA